MVDDEHLTEKIKASVLPRGPKAIAEPEKELRFTRAGQAPLFFFLGAILFAACVAVFILSTQDWGMEDPPLKGWWWLCLPGLFAVYGMIRLGLRCTRHAYIILSPLGIEIFPFFNAAKNLQVIYWSQVADAEFSPDAKNLVLHFSEEKKSGVIASLKPIPSSRRHLLEEAVLGVLEKRDSEA
ncbi:hypothetical protein JO972_07185 [Verrucomicrobiaceae bacterium 5K15]|uniref:Uncharacterized protein n=1 Tax=Oceaniferula flava TaxID=2800421 RepID=A0AAE2SEA2_9BACT|nr:hypothetical protein [Oceaniferula flavus]MBK1854736.1 hypothetical protein [Oceaniferula flavus]MBM1136042.1 hypothetical protein [Oceaniferula flavus]